MASISLTDPVAATTVTAGLHAGNNAALRTAINGGLDNTNVAGGAAIDQTKIAFTAWQAFTPAWTSVATAPAILNGTITGRYAQIGKTVFFEITLTAGTTTTFGSANAWTFSLPATANASAIIAGSARYIDASPVNYYPAIPYINTTTTLAVLTTAQPGTFWNSTAPVAGAVSDIIQIAGTYEAA